MHRTIHLPSLYAQELRALPRARFALAGLAVFAVVLTALAVVVIPSPSGLWSFALLVYGVGPVVTGTLSALLMARLRADGLTQTLFTMPVRSRTVLGTHLLVGLTLGMFYLAATLPFLGVVALHIGVPASVLRLLLGGVLLQFFAVVFGTLVGVFFTGRSVAGAVGLTAGFLILGMLAIPPVASMQLGGAFQGSLVMRMLHMSPYVLVSDGLGLLEPSVAAAAVAPMRALMVVTAQVLAMSALAMHIYVKEQGPDRWEGRTGRRLGLGAGALVVLLVAPLVVAGDDYMPIDEVVSERYGSSSYSKGAIVLVVPQGTPVAEATRDGEHPLDATGQNRRDLLVVLPAQAGRGLHDVRVVFGTDPYLTIEPNLVFLESLARPERHAHGAVVRIPVVLTPSEPLDLTSNVYQLWTNVTYTIDGETEPRVGAALSALEADVPWALVQLGAAGAPLALTATFGAVMRRLRVG
ncbi:MAG: hypothetical protein KY455_12690 [Euryarchaeota archaeon]|nr:hypothetical protein [Euryarchaeota archaeon]